MKKILTIILDGFGYREEEEGNAIKAARMKNYDKIWNTYPHTTIYASEEPIGLRKGQFGNSEIGHTTIGAGRIVLQNESLVDNLLLNADDNLTFQMLIDYTRSNPNQAVHLMGLCSNGLVHSDIDHFKKLYNRLVDNGVHNIYFHLITDGRDTGTNSAYEFISQIENEIKDREVGSIASLCGRYYAMDRDKKWERTKLYYDLITKAQGYEFNSPKEALDVSYNEKITDEFIKPIILDKKGVIKDNDSVIWLNYRSDRGKQIISTLTDINFEEFNTIKFSNLNVYTFFPLDKTIKTKNFLPTNQVENPLGIYLSKLGLSQARVAETEKYAHVTYFFDGAYNGKIENCDKYLIPSPKVATYDLKPEMSAVEVTKKTIDCMQKDYDFILVNFANPDMVGHTGNWNAAVKACITMDICLGKLLEVADENFYKIIILADHGNVDIMYDENKVPVTTHTLSKVPFIILDNKVKLADDGSLVNVAPTILEYMDIAVPKEMADTPSLITGYDE
ncbi:MAG: 2,3-bisphosphoglycerate-independent phosphoglycerate mutase [Bacilli bacterium]|nr:2,3-bisphosphoglycerate-independent phosphoglycerate mutase [Bacilli bacterium]